jgi:tetratricopeptide (TPR) repeat protein
MAQKCYEKAIQNGDYVLAYENLAKILVLQGKDMQRAQEFLKKALSLFPNSETLQSLQLYMQKK